ncbi:hypothetical protein ACVGWW_00850, partial [Enterobacter hormaechei]
MEPEVRSFKNKTVTHDNHTNMLHHPKTHPRTKQPPVRKNLYIKKKKPSQQITRFLKNVVPLTIK